MAANTGLCKSRGREEETGSAAFQAALPAADAMPTWTFTSPGDTQQGGRNQPDFFPPAVCRLFGVCIAVDERALDFFDGVGHVDAARAGFGAVEDRAAAPDAHPITQDVQAFGGPKIGRA